MTAATCTSLWVSTPTMTSSAALSSWSPDTSWGMLDMVICLLIANGTDGHRRAGVGGQNCDGALLTARPLSGHAHPDRQQQAPPQATADRSDLRQVASGVAGQTTTWDGTPAIFTLKTRPGGGTRRYSQLHCAESGQARSLIEVGQITLTNSSKAARTLRFTVSSV